MKQDYPTAQPVGGYQQQAGGGGGFQQQPQPLGGFTFIEQPRQPGIASLEVQVRQGFIRKVFILLSIQLAVFTGVVLAFTLVPSLNDVALENPSLYYAFFAIAMVMLVWISCFADSLRPHPNGLIILGVFTLVWSVFLAMIASTYQTDDVVKALGITTLVSASLIAFSFQTRVDFTSWGSFIWVLFFAMLGTLIVYLITGSAGARLLYLALGVIAFSFYIVYDTQLIMGVYGNTPHRYEIGVDEYVFATAMLFVDITYLFIFILALLGGDNS